MQARVSRCFFCTWRSSMLEQKTMLRPAFPARPVRPDLCTKLSCSSNQYSVTPSSGVVGVAGLGQINRSGGVVGVTHVPVRRTGAVLRINVSREFQSNIPKLIIVNHTSII